MKIFSWIFKRFGTKRPSSNAKGVSYSYFDKDLEYELDSVLIGKDKAVYYRLQCPKYGKQITIKKELFDFIFRGPQCLAQEKESEILISNRQLSKSTKK